MGKKNRRMVVAAGEAKAAEVIPLPTPRPVEESSRSDDVNDDVVDGMRAAWHSKSKVEGWLAEYLAEFGDGSDRRSFLHFVIAQSGVLDGTSSVSPGQMVRWLRLEADRVEADGGGVAKDFGWTPEVTTRLGWFMKKGQGFHDLCLEVDQDQSHFVAGLVALAAGDFDLAALNLHKAGMLEAPPSVVEEEEV